MVTAVLVGRNGSGNAFSDGRELSDGAWMWIEIKHDDQIQASLCA